MPYSPTIQYLGQVDYTSTWHKMRDFTHQRDPDSRDEIWFLEHPPVFTQGTNGDPAHVLFAGDIPVIPIDRGGQVTYHGPGQLVVYPLLNIERRKLNVRTLVSLLEDSVIELLADLGIQAQNDPKAPGVYVGGAKIASIGLRIRKGCCYHGLSLNTQMDLTPFNQINPCGYANLAVTQVTAHHPSSTITSVTQQLEHILLQRLAGH